MRERDSEEMEIRGTEDAAGRLVGLHGPAHQMPDPMAPYSLPPYHLCDFFRPRILVPAVCIAFLLSSE